MTSRLWHGQRRLRKREKTWAKVPSNVSLRSTPWPISACVPRLSAALQVLKAPVAKTNRERERERERVIYIHIIPYIYIIYLIHRFFYTHILRILYYNPPHRMLAAQENRFKSTSMGSARQAMFGGRVADLTTCKRHHVSSKRAKTVHFVKGMINSPTWSVPQH